MPTNRQRTGGTDRDEADHDGYRDSREVRAENNERITREMIDGWFPGLEDVAKDADHDDRSGHNRLNDLIAAEWGHKATPDGVEKRTNEVERLRGLQFTEEEAQRLLDGPESERDLLAEIRDLLRGGDASDRAVVEMAKSVAEDEDADPLTRLEGMLITKMDRNGEDWQSVYYDRD